MYSCVPNFLQIAIFAIIIYIPQYNTNVNREFIFMNAGIFNATNVWEMSIHKLSRNLNRLCITECELRRAEKEASKWIKNELHDMKSDSCYVIRWYRLLVKYICSCSTMTSLVTANIIWRKPITPGDFWKFEHKGGEKQIKKPVCLMSVFCHENKCLSEIKQCYLNVMQSK